MQHPYIGLKATHTNKTASITGLVVAVGTGTGWAPHHDAFFPAMVAVLLLEDGAHVEVMMDTIRVDHAEAAARLAPGQVERWQAVSLSGYPPSDASDPAPRGWEPLSAWEPVGNNESHVLWRRPLRRVKP